MDRFARTIINKRKSIIVLCIIISIISAFLTFFVGINYNMADYLPQKAMSTTGIKVMNREFTQAIPNASVMVEDVSIVDAMDIKRQIAEVEGVNEVLWLDDVADLKMPLIMQDKKTVEGFYKDRSALYSVTIKDGAESAALSSIREIVGSEGAIAGEAANLTDMQSAAVTEVSLAVVILLPAIIIILLLSTTSWLEPILFLSAIGVSVIINMGTNIIFGEISFVTNSVSPILQLAVSMDYAIFLLHSFGDFRKKYDDVEEAMYHAIKASVTTVAASALTTLFGFLALVFMEFRIGPDLGICLAKGIVLSFVSVMVFLPALTLSLYKLIDKTSHRRIMPEFRNIGKYVSKIFVPVAVIVAVVIVPSFLGQGKTSFLYGYGDFDAKRELGRSTIAINEKFGRTNILAILVPKGDMAKESALTDRLEKHPHVKNVISYASAVGPTIPSGFLGEDITQQFYSENYSRIVLYTDLPDEGEMTFNAVEEINGIIYEHYDEAYMVGQSATLSDIKKVVEVDNSRVNLIAIAAVFLVVMFTFKSLSLPVILVLAIEVAIWINLSFPYFTGTSINYVGYLVLNTVQLGATIDYAILLTDNYMQKRRIMPAKDAIYESLSIAFRSILVSASILSFAGFTLYLTSSNSIVVDIGLLLGRGTLITMFMVICFLPAMLIIFDKLINKTTKGADFFLSP
ncbi:MAG TPA: MMPL family transporter [Clostridiaceae bacterium]|jgi:predicted RND superfamily exporter protein|nr:MMPL family transporter [Clostridiaceae bacterium]